MPVPRHLHSLSNWLALSLIAFTFLAGGCDDDTPDHIHDQATEQTTSSSDPATPACEGYEPAFAVRTYGGFIDDVLAYNAKPYGYSALLVDQACNVRLASPDYFGLHSTVLRPDEYLKFAAEVITPAFAKWNGANFGHECSDGGTTEYSTNLGTVRCLCGCDPAKVPAELVEPLAALEAWTTLLQSRAHVFEYSLGIAVIDSSNLQMWEPYSLLIADAFMPTTLSLDWATLATLELSNPHRLQEDAWMGALRRLRRDYDAWRIAHLEATHAVHQGLVLIEDPSGHRFALAIGELAEPLFDRYLTD